MKTGKSVVCKCERCNKPFKSYVKEEKTLCKACKAVIDEEKLKSITGQEIPKRMTRTRRDAIVNIIAKNHLIPITFAEHWLDTKLIPAKKGCPVLSTQNCFSGWKATFTVQFRDNVYSAEQIASIINLAGFGLGIGSGRSSGFGRYHIESIELMQEGL